MTSELTAAQAWTELEARAGGNDRISHADTALMRIVTPLGMVADVIVVSAPDEFVKDVMDTRLRGALLPHLAEVFGRPIGLAFTADAPTIAEPVRRPAARLADINSRLPHVDRRLGTAENVDLAAMTELDRAERAEQVRTLLREWSGYDPTPEEEREADEAIEAAVGRRAEGSQGVANTAQAPGAVTEADWAKRFGRSAGRELELGITPEWLAEHKAGIEEQRTAGRCAPPERTIGS